jgi:hypothetical protein
MKLTTKNYFTPENKFVTASRIKDYKLDHYYFWQKHIKGIIKEEPTRAMIIGSAVDEWLTVSQNSFKKKYIAVTRRNLKNPPEKYVELTMSEYNMVVKLCERIETQQAFKDLKDYTAQEILSCDKLGLAGIADWYFYNKDTKTCIIVDLKTAKTINPYKYNFQALDLGYFLSQACYQLLLKAKYPDIQGFESRHLTIEKDNKEIFKVQTFILDQERIEGEKESIMDILHEIKTRKTWEPTNVKWEDSIPIGKIEEVSIL